MGALNWYRDDGPLATVLGSVLRRLSIGPVLLLALGILPLGVVLLMERDATPAVGAAIAWFVVIGGASAGRTRADGVDWLIPVEVRAAEYGTILALTWYADPQALPLAYAAIAAAAFHHYDVVYRLRHQKTEPSRLAGWLGGGWELRLILVYVLAVLDGLAWGLGILALWLGGMFLVESIRSWLRATVIESGEEMSIDAGGD